MHSGVYVVSRIQVELTLDSLIIAYIVLFF